MPFKYRIPAWVADIPLEYVNCNLCAADDGSRLRSDGPLHLVRCRNCDLVYVSPRLAEGTIRGMYNHDYFATGDSRARGYRDYIADQAFYLQTFRKRMRLIETYAEGKRLLDLGCAAGFFLQVVREQGWQVQGVEPAACVVEFARSQLGLDVFQGTLEEASFPSDSFDVVTMWDVLEHLTNPRQELSRINRVLRPGGLLVVETQNIGSWAPRVLGDNWIHYGNDLHLFHFRPATLSRLLKETGFQVIKITRGSAGKVCSLRFIADKLYRLNRTVYGLADALLRRWPSLAQHSIYINPGDEMIVCARRVQEAS